MAPRDYKVMKVVDDRINVDSPRILVTDDGPSSSTYQVVQPSNPASLNPVFSVQTPSFSTGINRKMIWRMRGSLVVSGTNLENLQLANRVAFRQFPIQSACTSVQVQVNDSTLSIGNMSQIIAGLLRKGVTSKSMGQGLSDVNCAPDLVAEYDQAMGATGVFDPPSYAPYSNYVSQSRCQGITGFTAAPAVGATSLTIDFDIYEPLICPPFEYGDDAATKSLFGISTLQVTANLGGVHRMLAMALAGSGATVTGVVLTPAVQQLHVNFVTPKDRSLIHNSEREYLYGYTSVQSFMSTLSAGAVASGASVTGASNTVDLPVVPKGFLVYAQYSETDRGDASQSLSDAFMPITSIQCSFMTRSGLLAGATADQLYQLNVKNGMAFPAWAHRGDQLQSSSATAPFSRGSGAPLYIDCAQDLSLPDGVSPGMAIRSQFSIDQITCFNNLGAAITAPRLVVIALVDGLMSNKGGSSSTLLGGVPSVDDDRYKDAPIVMRSELARMAANGGYGAGFFDFLKKAAKKVIPVLKKGLPFAEVAASALAPEALPALEGARRVIGGRQQRAPGRGRRGGALLGGARQEGHRLEMLLGDR